MGNIITDIINGDVDDFVEYVAESVDTRKESASGAFSRLYDRNNPPKKFGFTEAMISSTITNETNLVDIYSTLQKSGTDAKIKQYRKFNLEEFTGIRRNPDYSNTPEYDAYLKRNIGKVKVSGYSNHAVPRSILANAIAQETGEYPAAIEVAGYAPKDLFIATLELEKRYDYDQITGQCNLPVPGLSGPGRIVEEEVPLSSGGSYTKRKILDVPNPNIAEDGVIKELDVYLTDGINETSIRIPSHRYPKSAYLPQYNDVDSNIDWVDAGNKGYAARYILKSKPNRVLNWYHCPVAEGHFDNRLPLINEYFNDDLRHLPWMPLKIYKGYIDDDVYGTELANKVNKHLKYLGFTLPQLTNVIKDQASSEEIMHAYFGHGVNIASQDQADLRYLFEYLLNSALNVKGFVGQEYTKNYRGVKIIGQGSGNFDEFYDIGSMEFELSIDNLRFYSYDSGNLPVLNDKEIGEVVRIDAMNGNFQQYTFLKKTGDSTSVAVEISAAKMRYEPSAYPLGSDVNHSGAKFTFTLEHAHASPTDTLFIIPVDYEIAKIVVPANLQSDFYTYSALLMFGATTVVNLEWYQTQLFADFMTMASITLFIGSIITGNFTWTQFAINLAVTVAAGYAIELAIEEWGTDAGLVIIAVAIAYSVYSGDTSVTSAALPSSVDLIQIINLVIKKAGESIEDEMQGLAQESQEFQADYEKRMEELLELQKGLDPDGNLDLLAIKEPKTVINFNETPGQFYGRALASNPGPLSLRSVHLWHDGAVQLPEPGDLNNKFI